MGSPEQPMADSPPQQLPRFAQQSIYQVARELKKEQHTLYNCLASILSDAAFIQEIRLLYPDLPLLANLRAGGWYAPSPDGTCYFKSTDGHQNNCNFSVTRLNWHVAELAAQKGGVLVVDATRKGKRFPDALSKTIPIWAAVLNRAVARVRAYDAQKAQRRRTYAAADGHVFTAVADTQTTISVRSSEGAAAHAGGADRCSSAAEADAEAHSQQAAQRGLDEQWHFIQQQQQQASHGMAGQQQQHSPEQAQDRQNLVSTGSCTPSIDNRIQAAPGVPSCTHSSTHFVQLVVDCLGPSVDLMSGLGSSTAAAGGAFQDAAAAAPPAAALATCSSSAGVSASACGAAAGGGAAGSAGGCLAHACCCLHRSKSVHLSPQPSLHEWLDEMDVLRRLSIMAETRAALRSPGRVSCPSGCPCLAKLVEPHMVPLPDSNRATVCAGSAPAVSCLLSAAEEEAAPATPAAACCARAQFAEDVSAFAVADQASGAAGGCKSLAAAAGPAGATAAAAAAGPPSAPLPTTGKLAAPLGGVSSPAFLLPAGPSSLGLEADSEGEPMTPRLMFGSGNSSSNSSSSGEEAVVWDPSQAGTEAGPARAVHKQLRFADAPGSEDSSVDAAPRDFAFPSPHQLAASAGSSVGAEAAGHLAASGMASSRGSSCGSGLVRLPDMPVVVLNGTSHQPGDAASILDIWRGTDLEDVACLPGISDFQPGVYHMPEGAQQQQQQDLSADDACPSSGQQQQQQPLQSILHSVCADGSSRSGGKCTVSWAAEVCARSEQQLAGRVSVSNWLDDEETGAACDALCAFAVPALSPSCCSTAGSTEAGAEAEAGCEEPPASCHSLAWCSQGSGSVCSEDSRPSSRQSSSTTLGFSSSGALGGALAESSSVGSGCLAAAVDAAVEWDSALHLPLWVSAHEREAIEARLDGWVERLLEVGADVRGLAAVLRKPLRPLWVSQASLIWTNQVAHPSSLPFIPLLLVSASQPHSGDRQAVKAAWLSLARGAGSPERGLAAPGSSGALSDGSSSDDSSDEDGGDLGLGCSWGSNRSSSSRQGMLRRKQKRKQGKAPGSRSRADAELGSWSYMYVPGAGDDEESWAAGLTPALFWQHCDTLLRCGPSNVRQLVKQLVQLHKSASFGGAAASLAAAAVRGLTAAPTSSAGTGRPMSPLGPGRSSSGSGSSCAGHAAGSMPAVLVDKHHPAPQGCAGPGGAALHVLPAAPGAFWVGNTGLAVGNLEGASAADVWRAVDAVLCCGTAMVPVLQREYNAMRLAAARMPAVPVAPAVSSSAPTTSSAWVQHSRGKQAAQQAAGDRGHSSSFCTSSSAAHTHWVRQQQQLAAAGAADSTAAADQPALEFSKVNGTQGSRRPARKGGMLSALLSKAGASAAAAAAAGSGGDQAVEVPGAAAGPSPELQHAGSDASSVAGSDASSACSSSYYSACSEDGVAAAAGAYSSNSASGSALPRLKWLPIESAKRDRSSLKQHLQESLEFVSAHLAAGHTVLLHDVEGHDNCVCLAVAVLSGCFDPPAASAADGKSQAAEPSFVSAWLPSSQQQAQGSGAEAAPMLPAAPVSKQSVRQQLARVSGSYPLARPTRAMLKQVFNFFEERRREAP